MGKTCYTVTYGKAGGDEGDYAEPKVWVDFSSALQAAHQAIKKVGGDFSRVPPQASHVVSQWENGDMAVWLEAMELVE